MEPLTFHDGRVELYAEDCLAVLKLMPDCFVDAVITDPPYHLTSIVKRFGATSQADDNITSDRARRGADGMARLSRGFMGQQWDGGDIAFRPDVWRECLRVLKPGGHLASFSGTRTYHRMACAIEDAGFEIRDQLAWTYGSGFPKSHDVSKGIDKAAGAEREIVGERKKLQSYGANEIYGDGPDKGGVQLITAPATDAAREWQGWGTALKPSFEPICLAQKPLSPQHTLTILVPTIQELICRVDSCVATDTRLSEQVRANGFWNIVTLLSNYLAAVWGEESKFTTETAIGLTTDLRILKSLLSKLTPGTTTEGESRTGGGAFDASLAAAISTSALAKCERLALTTAGEIAIDWLAEEGSGPGGSKLGPAWEPICLARKPLSEGTVAANVLRWGTGAINVDACRVATDETITATRNIALGSSSGGVFGAADKPGVYEQKPGGRFPANLVHDGSPEVLAGFPESSGSGSARTLNRGKRDASGWGMQDAPGDLRDAGSGSAARFFYCAKASKKDRAGSNHPTVKPISLMAWLVRMLTPPGGLVLDPFAGTGTLAAATFQESKRAILIEREEAYRADIVRRVEALAPEHVLPLFGAAT